MRPTRPRHRLFAVAVVASTVVTWCNMAGVAANGRKVALVIGNSAYTVKPLDNPTRDAEAVAKAFRSMGFDEVVVAPDLKAEAMRSAIAAFGKKVGKDTEIAVVFFSGHGIEDDGRNYLIPIDAKLEVAADLELQAVSLSSVLAQIDQATKLKLVILDACRTPLFPLRGRAKDTGRGLGRVEPKRNTLVAYAAKEGTTADDGTGEHSPFTTALLRNMAAPNVDVRLMFGGVRDDVLEATSKPGLKPQEPHLYGTLGREQVFLWSGAQASAAPPVAVPAPSPAPALPTSPPPAQRTVDDPIFARSVQEELHRIGCLVPAADGRWGEQSRAAYSLYLRRAHLPDGEPTEAQLDKLRVTGANVCPRAPIAAERDQGPSAQDRGSPPRPAPSPPRSRPSEPGSGGNCPPPTQLANGFTCTDAAGREWIARNGRRERVPAR